MPAYKIGDKVRYKPVGGPNSKTSETTGTIRKAETSDTQLTGRNVHASEDEPRYEIENSHTRKSSAIKEANIIGRAA